ncbi:MAG TPA: hypothetical protein VGE74_01735, partial [Gemmata sp.]
ENAGGAVAQLLWSSDNQVKQIVPQAQLFSVPAQVRLVEADLVAKNIREANEETVGATVVERTDGNNAPLKEVVLKAIPNWTGKIRLELTGSASKITVYTKADGTGQVEFDGVHNVFDNADLPMTFYVQGDQSSVTMRDCGLRATPQVTQVTDVPVADQINFTVLWLDTQLYFSGTISADNDKLDTWKGRTADGNGGLGLQILSLANGVQDFGWAFEARGIVSPGDFSSATAGTVQLKMDRDVEVTIYNDKTLVPNPPNVPATYGNKIPIGNDPSAAQDRDDDPSTTGTYGVIYDLDAPGIILGNRPQGTIFRFRMNLREYSKVFIDGQWIRASDIEEGYIRFSIKQTAAGNGSTYVQVTPPMVGAVTGDNAAGLGQTALTWDLQ